MRQLLISEYPGKKLTLPEKRNVCKTNAVLPDTYGTNKYMKLPVWITGNFLFCWKWCVIQEPSNTLEHLWFLSYLRLLSASVLFVGGKNKQRSSHQKALISADKKHTYTQRTLLSWATVARFKILEHELCINALLKETVKRMKKEAKNLV